MKSPRVWYWLGGLAGVALISMALKENPRWREESPIVLFLAWGFVGIAGEIIALLRALRARDRTDDSRDSRPADGKVEITPMLGVTKTVNPCDPRFLRFDRLIASAAAPGATCLGTRDCPPFRGRIVWISLFIGRDGQAWSDTEIAEAHRAMIKAGVWLESEAIRWGAPVNVELADTYFAAQDDSWDEVQVALITHGDRFAPADAHEPAKLLKTASRAAASLGFRDAVDWLAQTHSRVAADLRVWIIHVRRGGCSQVIVEHDTDVGSIRFAVCHARETLFPEPLREAPRADPVTYAHEVLHLFGATDKYEVPLRTFPARTVTSRDVMRLSQSKLSRLRIDAGTAAEIGWG